MTPPHISGKQGIATSLRHLRLSYLTYLCLIALFTTGCSYFSPQDHIPNALETPASWHSEHASAPVKPWLKQLNAPQLEALVTKAIDNNPMLRSLQASIDVSEQQTWITQSSFWPHIDAGLRASRNQRNNASGISVASRRSNNVGFALDFLWEIDLWYKLGNALEASLHEQQAAHADLYAAQLSLAANIAKTWFDSITLKQHIELANKTIANYQNAQIIIERGYRRGIYQALDVRLARSNVFNAQNRKQQFVQQLDASVRSVQALAGDYPTGHFELADALPQPTHNISVSVPAALLERRPDIRSAAALFFASDQRLLKARKNMLPSIQLSGSGGTSTQKLDDIFNPQFLVWNIAGNLTQPLFHGLQLFAEREQAEARVRQAAADYAQVVLTAFQEVETTLAAKSLIARQATLTQAETAEAVAAQQLAEHDYIAGLTDIITLLDAQRRAYDAQSRLLDIRNQRLHNRINLYLALGGPLIDPQDSLVSSHP